MFQLIIDITMASLRVWIPDELKKLPAAAYINLHRARAQVPKGVALQRGAYADPPEPATVFLIHTNLATDDELASLMYAGCDSSKKDTNFHEEANRNLRLAQ